MTSSMQPPTLLSLPAGVDPETYRIDEVNRLLKRAAYTSIFSVPNAARPNTPIPSPRMPNALIGVEVNEDLHRFAVEVEEPSLEKGMRARNRVGEPVASVHIRWMVAPDDFEAAPGRTPPATELNPSVSQRFVMLNGELRFKDRAGSGFRAFGSGRTFPLMVDGQPQLRVGAVIDILEGRGSLTGKPGTIAVNGYIRPPSGLALNLMGRFMDRGGGLIAADGLSSLQQIPDPDPASTFFVFLGETDPDRPTRLIRSAAGQMIGSDVHERLRLVRIDFDVSSGERIASRFREGAIVGSLRARLYFNAMDPRPVSPIQTTDGVFTFVDRQGRTVGTVSANMVEGRAFRTELSGTPMPVFRFGGFGPIISGSGAFDGVAGLMSMNAGVSVMPRTLSNLYVLRFTDPNGRFRSIARGSGR